MPDKTPLANPPYLDRLRIARAMVPKLRRIHASGVSHAKIAAKAGISKAAVGFILAGSCVPTARTIAGLKKAMCLKAGAK
jgi:hypothetical protein